MKNLLVATAVVVFTLCNVGASAADLAGKSTQDGMISPSRLTEMGLSGLTVMSDRQAEEVRGEGFVLVFGRSFAGGSSDRYFKVRRRFAFGKSFSSNGGTFAGGWAISSSW